MEKKILAFALYCFLKIALWFRYRVTVKGLEHLNPQTLCKPGGILFLPNHPAVFVDPALVSLAVIRRYPLRPVIVEYMYYAPIIHSVMRLIDAIPIPNFGISSNSLKRKRGEKAISKVIHDLQKGDNFLIYPAGGLKNTAKEVIGGASAVHRILQEAPETNVVLVRTKGLWGSSFSKALTGKMPPILPTILKGIKTAFKNLLFFIPRRHVIIEFVPAPKDFPYGASRLDLNRYLENWYNQPDGLTPAASPHPGDSLILVSYSFWKEDLPSLSKTPAVTETDIRIQTIPENIQEKVVSKLAKMTEFPKEKIRPEMNLSVDLGLDSLDIGELLAFLQEQFEIENIPIQELTTVGKVMAIAAKQIVYEKEEEEAEKNIAKWHQKFPKESLTVAPGRIIPETFLNNCQRMGKRSACADARVGVVSYPKLKLRVLLLAEYIQTLPGKHVGILLPASVAAYVTVLACQMAGKVPVMLNWTIGPRHLEAVQSLAKMDVVFSSWAFLDRLQNVDLDGIDDLLIMLEDVRREFSLRDMLKALVLSKRSHSAILAKFGLDKVDEHDPAVILFTSGTESMPKGVPLSHFNLLKNMQAAIDAVEATTDDAFFGFLPPFHAFGFSTSGLLPLLSGIRAAYSPDPRDGETIAKGIQKWGITTICGAPTFLKALFNASKPEQIKTLRLCVSGAEKAPPDLFQLAKEKGVGHTVFEGYGITECSPALTMNRLNKVPHGVGEPIAGVELRIVHPETYAPTPQGEQGLILFRGPNVFSGYLNKEVASPFVTIEGKEWYKTGDLGYLDEQGRLVITGRLKRFVKIGGEMISLGAIEDVLIQKSLEKGWKIEEEGPSLAICAREAGEKSQVFLFTLLPISLEEANTMLRDGGFSNLVRISAVHQLSELPVMGTGKVNYRALEEKLK